MGLLKLGLSIIDEKVVRGVVVITVERKLLEPGTGALKNRIDTLVREGHKAMVVDLQHIPEMDSSDLGRLIRAHHSVRRIRGQIRLCGVQPRIGILLRMTRLDTVFSIYNSEHEAIEAATED